ncbi:3-hydroxyacyl-ACP dehydratase [Photobacterium nomapromontoriensis]|uniref:ApeI family dehydratase n=1 Tax=Photobacterium nomapromontoriensis TaxID=2910237 RepID=UPI003D0CBF11
MSKRKPVPLSLMGQGAERQLQLHIDPELSDFQGHFADHPVLPGVTHIDWAVKYACDVFGLVAAFGGMEVIKFQEPILPGMEVQLSLIWHEDKAKLQFSYTSLDRQGLPRLHSTGKVVLRRTFP